MARGSPLPWRQARSMCGRRRPHIFTPRSRYTGEEAVGVGSGSPARQSYILSPHELFAAVGTSYMPLTPSADAHLAQLRPQLRRSR